jgi:hypothetical protein
MSLTRHQKTGEENEITNNAADRGPGRRRVRDNRPGDPEGYERAQAVS